MREKKRKKEREEERNREIHIYIYIHIYTYIYIGVPTVCRGGGRNEDTAYIKANANNEGVFLNRHVTKNEMFVGSGIPLSHVEYMNK